MRRDRVEAHFPASGTLCQARASAPSSPFRTPAQAHADNGNDDAPLRSAIDARNPPDMGRSRDGRGNLREAMSPRNQRRGRFRHKKSPVAMTGPFELRGEDLNFRPSGYEPDELPGCSTPRHVFRKSERPFRDVGAARQELFGAPGVFWRFFRRLATRNAVSRR